MYLHTHCIFILHYFNLFSQIILLACLAQENIGLNLANKLTATHMEWKKNIMKVKLAAQTLSSSVADALEFFQSSNDIAFNNCNS